MGHKSDDQHLQKAFPEETLFVLMARDAAAPKTIVEWIKESLTSQPEGKLHEALDTAIKMAKQQAEIEKKKQAEKEKNMQFRNDVEC